MTRHPQNVLSIHACVLVAERHRNRLTLGPSARKFLMVRARLGVAMTGMTQAGCGGGSCCSELNADEMDDESRLECHANWSTATARGPGPSSAGCCSDSEQIGGDCPRNGCRQSLCQNQRAHDNSSSKKNCFNISSKLAHPKKREKHSDEYERVLKYGQFTQNTKSLESCKLQSNN